MLSQLSLPTGAKSEYSYDAMQRLTQVSNKTSANANISSYAYGFDAANQPQRDVRTWVDKTIGNNATRRTSFSYDTVDQLVSEVLNEAVPLTNKQYAYDAMGNRSASTNTTATSTFATSHQSNRLNQYRRVSTSWDGGANSSASSLSYDASGNLTKMASVGTGAGGSGQAEYSYDDADRLTSVVRKDGAGVNQSKSEYVYDGS